MNPLDATLAWSDFWIIMGASGLAVLTMYLILLVEETAKERRRAQRRPRSAEAHHTQFKNGGPQGPAQ